MQNVTNADIEMLNEETERTMDNLGLQHLQLGKLAFAWQEAIGYEPSRRSYELICNAMGERTSIESEMQTVREAVACIDENEKKLESALNSISDLDNEKLQLLASLGAIASEASNAGRLPRRLNPYLDDVKELEARLQETDNSTIVGKLKQRSIRKRLDEAYRKAGLDILESGRATMVPGPQAAAILAKITNIADTKDDVAQSMDEHQSRLFEAQDSLEEVGAYGSEEDHLKALEAKLKSVDTKLETLQTGYGGVLAEGMGTWLDDQAPKELKDCCREIARLEDVLKAQQLDMERLNSEKAAAIHREQADSLEGMIEHLESQISQMLEQKATLEKRLNEENRIMETLRQKQLELETRSRELRNI